MFAIHYYDMNSELDVCEKNSSRSRCLCSLLTSEYRLDQFEAETKSTQARRTEGNQFDCTTTPNTPCSKLMSHTLLLRELFGLLT
jgi:hypothetical protein